MDRAQEETILVIFFSRQALDSNLKTNYHLVSISTNVWPLCFVQALTFQFKSLNKNELKS